MLPGVDDVAIGNTLRVIRVRRQLRQADVARRAGVRRETVSRLERGGLGRLRVDEYRAIAAALAVRTDIRLRWQGAELDRVVNAAHADLHASVAHYIRELGAWLWHPEVSFSIYGERGVMDILAWHPATRSLLIIELKTEIADPQALAATMDRRMRLGREIARRFGWVPVTVSCWVVVAEGSTNRRHRSRHRTILDRAFPTDGRRMRSWLRRPTGSLSALSFWSDVGVGSVRRSVGQTRRVRRARHLADHA
jgi:transcriptional regulator with XRE-family HTH domain